MAIRAKYDGRCGFLPGLAVLIYGTWPLVGTATPDLKSDAPSANRTYAWARQATGPDGTTTHINPGHAAAGTARDSPREPARTAGRGASRVNDRSYLYTYDDLHRLIDAKLGKLNSTNDGIDPNGPTPRETHWDLDNLGNWSGGDSGPARINRQDR